MGGAAGRQVEMIITFLGTAAAEAYSVAVCE